MKKKIIIILLTLVIILTITGCGEKKDVNENTQFNSIATYMILTSENNGKDITVDSQIKYQEDLSNEVISIYNSKNITEQVYEKYGVKIVPTVKSMNEKNTHYETKLACGNLSSDECTQVHRLYNKELMAMGEKIYKLYIKRNDNYTISR